MKTVTNVVSTDDALRGLMIRPPSKGQWMRLARAYRPLQVAAASRLLTASVVVALLVGLGGCHTSAPDNATVLALIEQRSGFTATCPTGPDQTPPLAALWEDGLTEEEAVVIALWQNAAFQDLLVDLKLTRADLIQAKLLPNPELWYLNPVGVKQLEYAIEFPIEVLWLRPFRIASARFENDRACQRLVQNGLDLIRDVRQAYADLLLAHARLRVAGEGQRLRTRIADLAEARLKAGDVSPLENTTARIDSHLAEQALVRTRYDVALAEERLRNLLGIGTCRQPLELIANTTPRVDLDACLLTTEALDTRPDATAAHAAMAAADERARLSRLSWFRFLGILDANGKGLKGHEIGPGFRVTIPIFNWGQGGIARADAELERTQRQWQTLHDLIILEVNRAFAQYQQARAELEYLESKVYPELETAVTRADRAFKEGNTTYLLALEATRQLLDSHMRAAQLHADLRRAWADLERSVGRRLYPPAATAGNAPEVLPMPRPELEPKEPAP